MPKEAGSEVGYHSIPKRKPEGEILAKMGRPSRKRKKTMSTRATREMRAREKKIFPTTFSLRLRVIIKAFSIPLLLLLVVVIPAQAVIHRLPLAQELLP